jgi:hypothetical protein
MCWGKGEAQGLLSLPFEKRIGRTAGKSGGYFVLETG